MPYRVADANGATASSTIRITVTPVTPVANPDTATTPFSTLVRTNVLANDTPGSAAAPLVPSSVRLVNAAGAQVVTLTNAAGTYAVNADGTISFQPTSTFQGTAPAVTYSVADANGTRTTSTYTVTVQAPATPNANPDTATTPQNVPITVNPAANDTPGPTGAAIVPANVRLIDGTGTLVTTLTVAGQGTYTVNTGTGAVTFTPIATFTGTATAVPYRVFDTNGASADSTITITVGSVIPVANPDTATTPFQTAVTTNVVGNDTPGAPTAPIDPASLRLVNAAGALVTTLTTTAGTYTANANGTITFTPAAGFQGPAPAVRYSIADTNGTRAQSTYTVTVAAPAPPTANPDTGTTPQNVDITVNPAANDAAGPTGAAIVPTTVRLLDAGGTPVTTLTNAQGTYTVNTATGAVTFDPVATFTGTATAVPYRVADANGATAASTITITVTPVNPAAANDTATTAFQTPVTSNVLANDTPGSAVDPLVPGSLRLVNGAGALVTTLTTAAGTYTANPDGTITFTPAAGFQGAAPPVTYSVADANTTRVTATYTVTVLAPAPPAANPDTGTTPQNTPITVNPATNDTPGPSGAAIVPASVRLLNAAGTAVTTLTNAQGTYTVNTTTGAVTFTPVASFTGEATPVPYRVADANGATASSTITITVTPITPTANPDTRAGTFNTALTADVLVNDTAGAAGAPLVPSSVRLVNGAGALVTTLTTAAVTYVANADGTITFTPVAGFQGAAPAVTYSVADANGTRVTTTLTVTIAAPAAPVANPDTGTTPQGTPITVTPPANDTPGPTGAALVPGSVRLLDTAGNPVTTRTVNGEGTYTVNTTTGAVTFAPVATFTGTATPVPYRITDTNGATAASTITITVTAVTPTAAPDTATTAYATPVTTNVLANDTAGNPATPLVANTLRLVNPAGVRVTTLATAAGTYTANADGTITFTPAAGFQGAAPPVTYSIADANGTRAQSTYTVTVAAPTPPVANPDTATTPQNVDITVSPAANDTPGPSGAAIVPASLRLLNSVGNPVTTLTTAEGTYTVNTTTGAVTFDPVATFSGVATAVPYRIVDANGATATSSITITVTAVVPTANPDTATTPFRTAVTIPVLGNDTAGAATAPLVPSSLRLVGAGGTLVTSLTTAAGTYTANADGTITFTPDAAFQGTAPAVTYSIADANGTRATSTYTVTVAAPVPPAANPDTPTTQQNVPATINPLANDTPGPSGAALVPGSVRLLLTGSESPVTTLTVAGQGTYTVNTTTGAVTFTPIATFTGEATAVPYRVADANGATATSTIRFTVTAVTPTAAPDTASTHYDQPVTTNVLANDAPGTPGAPLVPNTVRLVTPGTGALVSTYTDAQGTFTAAANGAITFDPAPSFQGGTDSITYSVADANGTRVTSTYTVTVYGPPAAQPDASTTPQNTPVTLTPLGNDAPSQPIPGEATPPAIVPGSLTLLDAAGNPVGSVTLPGVGTYAVAAGGTVTFTPVAAFAGTTAPVGYRFTDSIGNTAASTLTVTVTAVVPDAIDDDATTPFGNPGHHQRAGERRARQRGRAAGAELAAAGEPGRGAGHHADHRGGHLHRQPGRDDHVHAGRRLHR